MISFLVFIYERLSKAGAMGLLIFGPQDRRGTITNLSLFRCRTKTGEKLVICKLNLSVVKSIVNADVDSADNKTLSYSVNVHSGLLALAAFCYVTLRSLAHNVLLRVMCQTSLSVGDLINLP